jgi:hypothetical protein
MEARMTNLLTLLACISMIESGDDDKAIGDNGRSRGRYQIQEATWKEANPPSCYPWKTHAHSPSVAKAAATFTISKRIRQFEEKNRREPCTREIYLLWNCPARVMNPSKKALATAKRFEDLVKSKEGK